MSGVWSESVVVGAVALYFAVHRHDLLNTALLGDCAYLNLVKLRTGK